MRILRLWWLASSVPALFALGCDNGDNVDQPNFGDASLDGSLDVPLETSDATDAGEAGPEVGDEPSPEAEAGEAEAGEVDAEAGPEPDALVPGVCGDGVLNLGETCDDGFRDPCGTCNADCTGPGDGRSHAACGCVATGDAGVAADAGADAALAGVGEDFTRDMVGCPGHVYWENRGTLCAAGYSPCTADEWVARRAGLVPNHHYWTNDNLKYIYESPDGVHDGCYYSKTYGGDCATATHVCADIDTDPEGNRCSPTPSTYPRNCGRLDPTPPTNDYFGGYNGNLTAGTLCCCGDSGVGCSAGAQVGDVFPNGMFGCTGRVRWQSRSGLCAPGCTVCTAQEWTDGRQGQAPTHNYWTNDNLKVSGWDDGICNVSKLYGTDGSPDPMRVCGGHRDAEGNECFWINCGLADIPPPPNEYLGGCSDTWAGTLCCKP